MASREAKKSAKAKEFKKEALDYVDWNFFLLDRMSTPYERSVVTAPLDGFVPFSLSKSYRKGQGTAAFRKYQSLIEELTGLEKNDSPEARERRDIVHGDIQQMDKAFKLLLQYEEAPNPDTMSLRDVQKELQKRHLRQYGILDEVRQRLKDANNSLLNRAKGIIKFVQTRDLREMNPSHLSSSQPSSQDTPKTLGKAKERILALAATMGGTKSSKSRTYKKKHKSKRKSKCKSKCKRKCKQTAKNKLKRKYKNTHKSKRRCKRQCTIKCKN